MRSICCGKNGLFLSLSSLQLQELDERMRALLLNNLKHMTVSSLYSNHKITLAATAVLANDYSIEVSCEQSAEIALH